MWNNIYLKFSHTHVKGATLGFALQRLKKQKVILSSDTCFKLTA